MAQTAKSARLEARVKPEQMRLLRRAAELQGRSITDFVLAAAQDAALRAIAESEVIRLTRRASKAFAAALIDPPPAYPGLARAVKHARRLIADP